MTDGLTRRRLLQVTAGALAGGLVRPRLTAARQADTDCDVCIVGSGFAGTFLGQRLASHGLRVTIVEAGPRLSRDADDNGAAELFPCGSDGDYAFPVDETRTIALGGTSRQWNGVVSRLHPDDFVSGTRFRAGADWPIAYDDLDAHYCEAERQMNVQGGPFVAGAEPPRCRYPDEAASYQSPASLFPGRSESFFPLAFALGSDGRPLRLDSAPLDAFAAMPGAALLINHPVTALVADEGGRFVAVRTTTAVGRAIDIRARAIVVAAGVIETARLLLVTAASAGVGSLRLSPAAGAHFHAHPRYRTTVPAPRPELERPPGIHRSHSAGDVARTEGTGAFHVDVHTGGAQPIVDVMLELEPAAANRIHLDASASDRWGRPGLRLRSSWTARDRRTRERGLAMLGEMVRALGTPGAPGPAERWFHPAGVCRMAHDDRYGVVDTDGRVFGSANLYVAGAAVFPASGSTNPTLTIVALALRLGDHLARRLRDGR